MMSNLPPHAPPHHAPPHASPALSTEDNPKTNKPVEVEVAYVPTENAENEPVESLPTKMHKLLKGRYGWCIALSIIGAAVGGIYNYTNTHLKYVSVGTLEIVPTQMVILNKLENTTLPQFDRFVSSQVKMLQSQAITETAIQNDAWTRLGGPQNAQAILDFMDALKINRDPKGQSIDIMFINRDRTIAQVAVESVIQAYMKIHESKEFEGEEQRIRVLEDKRAALTTKLTQITEQILIAGSEYGSDTLAPIYQRQLYSLSQLQDQLRIAESDYKIAQQLMEHNGGKNGLATLDQIAAVDDQVRMLVNNRNNLELQLTHARARYGDNHPQVDRFRADMAATQAGIDERVARYSQITSNGQTGSPTNTMLETKLAEVERLREMVRILKDDTSVLGKKNLTIKSYESQAALARKKLNDINSRLDRLRTEATNSGRVRVISNGTLPLEPVNQSERVRKAISGVGMGGFAGFGIVMLYALFNRRYRYSHDTVSSFGDVSLLGILPTLPDDLADDEQAATAAHCVHNIRTLLQIGPHAQNRRTFAITSPASGTGKTSLSLALGVSFASTGARTLLIDFDLFGANLTKRVNRITRRRIGRILQRENLITEAQLIEALERARINGQKLGETLIAMDTLTQNDLEHALSIQEKTEVGLLDALGGENVDECIGDTGIDNLYLLATGGATPKHAGQLSPNIVRRILEQARQNYDTVIIDTGPVPGSLEASLIVTQVDAVVFTVSRGEQRQFAERAINHLTSIGARVAGVVFNRADSDDLDATSYSMRSRISSSTDPRDRSLNHILGPAARETTNRLGPIAGAVASYLPDAKKSDPNDNGVSGFNGSNGSNQNV